MAQLTDFSHYGGDDRIVALPGAVPPALDT